MRIIFSLALFLAASPASPAFAESRNFSVSDFDRVRIEGPYAVTLSTNRSPFARASGPMRAIDGVKIEVQGRTLIVRSDRTSSGTPSTGNAGPVTIDIGTHDVAQASLSGTGSLAIDRVRGLSFSMTLAGSGSGSIAAADVDVLRIALDGSTSARVAGRADKFTAVLRGAGSLDAASLRTKNADLNAQGPSLASIDASDTARITVSGTASVTKTGDGACSLKTIGSATVSGC